MCEDTIEEDDGQGNQKLYRVIRVPFRVVFVSGNLKMRFHVQQSQREGKVFYALLPQDLSHTFVPDSGFVCMQIDFVNTREGRLITRLLATFDIKPQSEHETVVCLDAKIKAKQLPPPPFKSMVKGTVQCSQQKATSTNACTLPVQ